MRPKRGVARKGEQPNRGLLGVVCERAVDELVRSDGRASGLKFNKLLCQLHRTFSQASNKAYHFGLPRRWYLYGEVVDASQLSDIARFHSLQDADEIGTNVDIVPQGPRKHPDGFDEEVTRMVREFVSKYSGSTGVETMLQDHYTHAPLDFQRAFLDWSQLSLGIIHGYKQDNPGKLVAAFGRLEKEYPAEFDPRLTVAFNRLVLYLAPSIAQRAYGDAHELKRQDRMVWSFWEAFCQLLSVRYNADEPPEQIVRFAKHAEVEIEAYQRRLVAELQSGYALEPLTDSAAPVISSATAGALADEILAALKEGY